MQVNTLSRPQIEAAQTAIDAFLFKEGDGKERWESSFTKDPKQFDTLINRLVKYKQDVMRYFRKQYENRYNLINQNVVKADEEDDYFYQDIWDQQDQDLAGIVENNNSTGYDLGILMLANSLARTVDFSSVDASKEITDRAITTSQGINDTTRKRALKAIQTSMDLGEDRAALDERLKKVFVNSFRGSVIAEYETLTSFMEGKQGLALNLELGFKTWLGSQAHDRICGDTNGEVVPVDKPFGNGLMKPLAHVGCRCDVAYSEKESDLL